MKTLKMTVRALVLALLVPVALVTAGAMVHAQAGGDRGAKPAPGTTKPAPGTAKPAQPGTTKPQPAPSTATGPGATPVPAGTAVPPLPGSSAAVPATTPAGGATSVAPTVATPALTPPSDYVIGAGDVLGVVFWRQQDMSAEVVVRPDGRISIPLLNEIDVTGLTPEQLRQKLTTAAQKYVQDPNVTVVVKQINSRRVFITGQVARPGPYSLTSSLNVLQLISIAGGLLEYADAKNILVLRNVNGRATQFTFNYKDMINRKNLKQNIDLRPDDTVIVP